MLFFLTFYSSKNPENMYESFSESILSFLNEPNHLEKDLFIMMNVFEQESHKCTSQKGEHLSL